MFVTTRVHKRKGHKMTTDEIKFHWQAGFDSADQYSKDKLRSMEAEMESLNDELMLRTSDYNTFERLRNWTAQNSERRMSWQIYPQV